MHIGMSSEQRESNLSHQHAIFRKSKDAMKSFGDD